MKVTLKYQIFVLLAAAALLAACGGGEPAVTEEPTEVGALPLCAAADLVAPVLISPANNEIGPVYGSEVITEISYPDADCQPEAFEKFISPSPSLDGDANIFNPSDVNIFNAPDGFNGSGQLSTTLEDCTQYYWKARALVGATAGPFSEIFTFYTNFGGACVVPETLKPVCDSAEILAPEIVAPMTGEINPEYVDEVITEIHYPNADCNPEYFEKEVTDDPNFISDANFIINPGPVNILNPVGEFSGSGQLTTTLEDCTQYYMRAHAVIGGVAGPDSEIITFYIDKNGHCEIPPFFIQQVQVIPNENVNCRLGPSATYFDIVATLYAGQQYTPLGQGPDHLWLLFKQPNGGLNCWAFTGNLNLTCHGETADIVNSTDCFLPVFEYPELPTPEPTPTFTPEPVVPFVPECNDKKDNDGDGRMDFPSDTSCFNASDNDESN